MCVFLQFLQVNELNRPRFHQERDILSALRLQRYFSFYKPFDMCRTLKKAGKHDIVFFSPQSILEDNLLSAVKTHEQKHRKRAGNMKISSESALSPPLNHNCMRVNYDGCAARHLIQGVWTEALCDPDRRQNQCS